MELIQIADKISVIDSGATMVGVLEGQDGFILIDSGFNKRQAKKIDNLCKNSVVEIYHTHTHADHIGGSAYFAESCGAKLYVPAAELSFALMTELEGAMLSGGILPCATDNPFLLASSIPSAKPIWQMPIRTGGFEILPITTNGHSPAHTSYLVNGVLFLGDCVLSEENIKKHGILYLFNAEMAYNTLGTIQNIDYERVVICHKGVLSRDECGELIMLQRRHIERIKGVVLESVNDNSAEEIARDVAQKLGIPLMWEESWFLVSSTVKGYLSWLKKEGIIAKKYENVVKWGKI